MQTSIRILIGDIFDRLAELPAESVHCCVTSPPYWGLRSYLPKGSPLKSKEMGSEPTPEAWAKRQVEVFREVRRVLRSDGTLWLNLGDCYGRGKVKDEATLAAGGKRNSNAQSDRKAPAYKDGDHVQLGPMLSEALRRDGWYLRQVQIWAKGWSFGQTKDDSQMLLGALAEECPELLEEDHPGAVMPGSQNGWRWERCRVKVAPRPLPNTRYARMSGHGLSRGKGGSESGAATATYADCPGCPKCEKHGGYVLRKGAWRTTDAFEYLYLLSKSKCYYGDREAVAEAASAATHSRGPQYHRTNKMADEGTGVRSNTGFEEATWGQVSTRNLRNVWRIATKGYKGSHYATFPTALVVPCIKASTSQRGVCATCGAPWAKVVKLNKAYADAKTVAPGWNEIPGGGKRMAGGTHAQSLPPKSRTIAWWPTCECGEPSAVPAVVLDPFAGSGTVGEVAAELGRDAILIDLDPRNERLIRKRLRKVGLMAEVTA